MLLLLELLQADWIMLDQLLMNSEVMIGWLNCSLKYDWLVTNHAEISLDNALLAKKVFEALADD